MVKKHYLVLVSKQAEKDLKKLKTAGLSSKAKELYEIIKLDPFQKYPPYEALKGELRGFYSRRINIKHRLVYSVDKKSRTVRIFRMWTHYEK